MLVVPPPPLPPRRLPPVVIIVIQVFVLAVVLSFAMLVLNAGVQAVAAGAFVSLVVPAATRAGGRIVAAITSPNPRGAGSD